jgi:alkylhydroperoxidase/carboxymuconolactone decarboxylase family protein YurZ
MKLFVLALASIFLIGLACANANQTAAAEPGAASGGGAEPQVKGHVQGNVNVGNDKETLLSVVTQLLPYIGYPRTLTAIKCINEVLPESKQLK